MRGNWGCLATPCHGSARVLFVVILAGASLGLAGPKQAAPAGPAASIKQATPLEAPARCRFAFEMSAKAPATSGGVVDAKGRFVRTLWTVEPRSAGRHVVEWDGLDELGQPAPRGNYRLRVIVNGSVYRNVGTLGNTGWPPGEAQHIQHGVLSLAVNKAGNIFTANGWEEAGHDFKVQGPDGKTLFHARYQIRNGNPNGAPYAIAVDDTHIYCAMFGWANEQSKSKQQIQRFRITDGAHEPFTDPALKPTAGHIELYEWPERQIPPTVAEEDAALMRQPIRALAVFNQTIFAADCLGNKIHKFHKVTGAQQGHFPVKFPHALAIDRKGRLWVGHERGKVSVFDVDGKEQGIRLDGQGDIRSLSFAPDGRLVVADGAANTVRFFDTTKNPPSPVGTFGGPAQLGQYAPDRFDDLRGAAVDAAGNLIVISGVRGGGARIVKFSPEAKCLWDHMAIAFCETGNYSRRRPDELLNPRFQRMALTDKNAGKWEYRGMALDGDPKLLWGPHGVLRFVELGNAEFVYQCYGDGMQVYRRHNDVYRLVAMVGGAEPSPDGRFNHDLPPEQRQQPGQWSWTDANGNAKVDPTEVTWHALPNKAAYAVYGMNTNRKGSILYCELHSKGIWELPVARLDSAGNPVYDWAQARQLVPREEDGPTKFLPLMAVYGDDDEAIYAIGRSKLWPAPGGKEAGYIWMGGWALAKYDLKGRRQWFVKLPVVCPGLCEIPGGKGVMLGYYREGHVLHYEPGGLLIGIAKLGKAAGNQTGWMDTTGSLSVNRDPRDGWLDVFGEDSYLNRIIWYRVDDRDIRVREFPPVAD